ncbi:LysR substrate-binding domain-containing protein [Pseudomonas fontis]|uniref:LysR substrate-binding domain-containing protein n=1 Tax=Pseudomonas fontis TaxID=2942633 RepID=A0ABT5NUR7_9PSED|nr:LysR substrate-binding domain-containing protein [Pseudomonas fontis]MDD0975916.1 LysR substrate-binding domain-containing protein [Pseudomonas fontis]MDD0991918.1 LysR substrate-binding domain-containing protein [Pseudomonas fontis]
MFAKLPLTALRAFESAARLGGFKAAADELVVTPAAISHQIKTLETSLGVQLFTRTGQGVLLNTNGERLQRQVHAALHDIHLSLAAFQCEPDPLQLNLTTTAAFASLWLIPRLGEFHRRHPQIRVRVQTHNQVIDLHRDSSLDLAIRATFSTDPSLYALPLFDEHFSVYAPPGWRVPEADGALELIDAPWISATQLPIDWEHWCAQAGHEDWLGRAIRHGYDDEQYALQAAMAGHGLVLASNVLVSDSLARGLLVPWREDIRLPAAHYAAVCVPGREREPAVRAFMDWLANLI